MTSIKARGCTRRILEENETGKNTVHDPGSSEHNHRIPKPLGEAFLSLLERDQRRMLRICTRLESIADGLPGSGKLRRTAREIAFLDRAFDRHMFIHERFLFPLVRSLCDSRESFEPMLCQLEAEHATDQGLIFEITAAYAGAIGSTPRAVGVPLCTLGYLLRAFFENFRRHAAWEKMLLHPVVKNQFISETPKHQHDAVLRYSIGAGRSGRWFPAVVG
nr:hemerythrin domain-containing protein [Rhodomicrobium vannielii]